MSRRRIACGSCSDRRSCHSLSHRIDAVDRPWRRRLYVETLEHRRLLSCTHSQTIEDVGILLEPYVNADVIEYVTVVTHGFQLLNDGGDSLRDLAMDIRDLAETFNNIAGASQSAWLLDYEVTEDGGQACFDMDMQSGSIVPMQPGPPNHVVLQFDWAPESNEESAGWGEAAGDALFSTLVEVGLVDVTAGINNPLLHFIGHSFGTAVTSEVVERLASFDVPVAHLTYLDPHDFDQGLDFDGSQRLFDIGKPAEYGVSVWDNVGFADVYYQTRNANGALVPDEGRTPVADRYQALSTDSWTTNCLTLAKHRIQRRTLLETTAMSGLTFTQRR